MPNKEDHPANNEKTNSLSSKEDLKSLLKKLISEQTKKHTDSCLLTHTTKR
jgi:hypothetical protein